MHQNGQCKVIANGSSPDGGKAHSWNSNTGGKAKAMGKCASIDRYGRGKGYKRKPGTHGKDSKLGTEAMGIMHYGFAHSKCHHNTWVGGGRPGLK